MRKPARRSDRVSLQLQVRVSGTFAMGREFTTNTRTLLISRHGAKILLGHEIIPYSTLNIGCLETQKEADARLVGFMGEEPDGPSYGIEFLDKNVNLWNIAFPPLTESAKAVARLLLECPRCHAIELAYLNEIEALVFQVNHYVPRTCGNCNDLSLWKQAESMVSRTPIPSPAQPVSKRQSNAETPIRTRNERKEIRFSLQFTACVRSLRLGEEVVATEKLSRGGFSFQSERCYAVDDLVEVAVPYNRDSGNIFVLGSHCSSRGPSRARTDPLRRVVCQTS
ncbi:MAG: hypothetical protein HY313_02750 [Acidobacteria bacterium]|nr:hypothetical protein [Acidobacteriota bacterium]